MLIANCCNIRFKYKSSSARIEGVLSKVSFTKNQLDGHYVEERDKIFNKCVTERQMLIQLECYMQASFSSEVKSPSRFLSKRSFSCNVPDSLCKALELHYNKKEKKEKKKESQNGQVIKSKTHDSRRLQIKPMQISLQSLIEANKSSCNLGRIFVEYSSARLVCGMTSLMVKT